VHCGFREFKKNRSNVSIGRLGSIQFRFTGGSESFNGKGRDECLSMEWFKDRIDAKTTIY